MHDVEVESCCRIVASHSGVVEPIRRRLELAIFLLCLRCKMHILKGETRGCQMLRTRRYPAKLLVCLYSLTYYALLVTCQLQSSTMTIASTLNSSMTLVSQNGVFEVGFSFQVRPNLATPMYMLATWYHVADKKVVWVADRSMAVSSNNTSLTLSSQGDLQVYDNSQRPPELVWHSNTTDMNVTKLTIEDTGNLVLLTATDKVVWQSFDTPTDTLLPNQTFAATSGYTIVAWEGAGDWRAGNYSLAWKSNYLTTSWQPPPTLRTLKPDYWNSSSFSQATLTSDGDFRGVFASGVSSNSIAAAAVLGVQGRLLRLTLDKDGNLRMHSWSEASANRSANWTVEWEALTDACLVPGYCGLNSICINGSCACPGTFERVDLADSRSGCRRVEPAAFCTANATRDGFVPASFGVGTQFVEWWGNDIATLQNTNLAYCMNECLATCECQAVISENPDASTGNIRYCWHKKALLNGVPTAARWSYLRVAANTSDHYNSPDQPPDQVTPQNTSKLRIVLPSTLGSVVVLMALLAMAIVAVRNVQQKLLWKSLQNKWAAAKGSLVRFTYREILLMTGNFELKVGEGGFGTVFKGQIIENIGSNSTENVEDPNSAKEMVLAVAVKELRKELSTHVEKEFMNEVEILGVIHHVHLVSLLGYCVDGHHRLLVYEYLERGSLDRVLFHDENSGSDRPVLEWATRFGIAIQAARGLAYLHDDCRQRIIHCDVKPENILLDSASHVKVADFGLSRIRNRDHSAQTRSKTRHIRGTLGYLAPEYQTDARITNKVDVFSFGMVLLEIVSGRRNLRVSPVDAPDLYFPTWAFPKLETAAFAAVVDPAVAVWDPDEVKRALRVAFWCVNERPQARPAMRDVVHMLQGHVAVPLPVPRPGFFDTLEFTDDSADQIKHLVSVQA